MEWISNWIQGIIVAVIISTIIEMILPEGNSKKYIKVVIGVYILFCIISPVITKITKKSPNLSNVLDLNEYIQSSNTKNYQDVSKSRENQIKEVYKTSLKNDIKQKINSKGYEIIEIELEIENNEQYTLKTINLNLEKNQNTNNESSNIQSINEVKINLNDQKEEKNIKEEIGIIEQKEIKKYLSECYGIDEKNINIR